jgi:hypothetical protein
MKDDGVALVQGEIGLVDARERQMARASDLLAGVFIRLADIDKDRTTIEQAPCFGWTYLGKRHD